MSFRLAFVCFTLCAAGCSVYDPALVPNDAGGMDAGDAATTCPPLATPPARPSQEDDGDNEVVFALRNITLNQDGERWKTIGYDLDGLCSGTPDGPIECDPISSSATSTQDGEHGVDNAFGRTITPLLLVAYPTLEDEARMYESYGLGAIILRIRDWNGDAEDSHVHATLSQSVYGTPALSDGGTPMPELPDGGPSYEDGGEPPFPQWNGDDYWWLREDSFYDGDPERPVIVDSNAYVSGRTLVMRIPDGREINFAGDTRGINFRLSDARLTADISTDGATVPRAVLVGRWAYDDVLSAVQHAGVCPGNPLYTTLSNLLRTAVDVRAVPGSGGPGVECDAVSVGIAFDGVSAHLGGVAPAYPLPEPCAARE